MGLMLSVIVFCVGVAEALDCWHHLLLHLVQPQYNPPPHSVNPKTDVLCERELHPPAESRRTSSIDISWPKDLSPDDNLHVIKKRSHIDVERNIENSRDPLGHRKLEQDGTDIFNISSTYNENFESCPRITVQPPDISGYTEQYSPPGSPGSSPERLELSVIIESDSSSEVDEPSQIENLSYSMVNKTEISKFPSKQNDISSESTNNLNKFSEPSCTEVGSDHEENRADEDHLTAQPLLNLTTPEICGSARISEHVTNEGSDESIPKYTPMFTTDLPVFTNNMLSDNVQRVSCYYPGKDTLCQKVSKEILIATSDNSLGGDITEASDIEVCSYLTNSATIPDATQGNAFENHPRPVNVDEVSKPMSEYPEIRLMGSSPIPVADSPDSSLNTSDASWMAKSKTSDRPLIVRFSPTSQDIANEFMSVSKTDLTAFGNKKDPENDEFLCESLKGRDFQERSYSKEKSQGILIHHRDENKRVNHNVPYVGNLAQIPDNLIENETTNGNKTEKRNIVDPGSNASSSNLVQPDTNSSSSSLSGIPQLPEDTKEILAYTPSHSADNGFTNSKGSTDISNSMNYDMMQYSSTDSSNAIGQSEIPFSSKEKKGVAALEKNTDIKDKLSSEVSSGLTKHSTTMKTVTKASPTNAASADESENICHDSCLMPSLDIEAESVYLEIDKKENRTRKTLEGNLQESLSPGKGSGLISPHMDPVKQKRNNTIKLTSNGTPPESDNIVVVSQAKESSEQDHVDQLAETASPAVGEVPQPDKDFHLKAGPSTSANEGGLSSSTSKTENPEDKAFWLIFSGEYTKAMNKDWHSGHFCCWQCDESLTGQRYVLRDDHPYCIKCYESVFANGCEECSKTIGIDSKDLSYKDKHWHEACFLCNKCRISLVDKQFGSKLDKIFCGNCYDAQFASRCDGCGNIFKAGTKKMEYKTRQWHEPCFACCVCKSPIGTKSFIPREQEIYCATCYEEKFATRCVKCNKIITSGGVTYKNEPWHRECFTCTNCNTSLAGQRFTSRDEKPYCADCFGELFAKRCTACSKPITGIGGTRFISFEDRHWHNDCFICASCKASLVGRGFITDAEDIICPECAKQKLM